MASGSVMDGWKDRILEQLETSIVIVFLLSTQKPHLG